MQVRPDAQGMRHAASQFRSKADRVAVVLGRLDGQVNSMVYAGPAADQFRAAMSWERNRLSEIVKALGRVTDILNDAAARVEADPLGYYGAQGAGGACVMITIEPMELIATSETLRICSIEAADIGSQLWGCAQCPMPADVQAVVDQLVVAADRALDSVAAQLISQAIDLTKRAIIAITDSQAATMVVGTNSTTATIGGQSLLGGTMVIGGWSPFDGMTITSGGSTIDVSTRDALYGSTMSIGGPDPYGGITITSPDGTPIDDSTLLSNFSIGAPDYRGTMMESVMMFAEMGQQHQQSAQQMINAIISNPNSSADEIAIAFNAQRSLDNSSGHILAPSRRDLEIQAGYPLTITEIKERSPRTILDPVNIFDIR